MSHGNAVQAFNAEGELGLVDDIWNACWHYNAGLGQACSGALWTAVRNHQRLLQAGMQDVPWKLRQSSMTLGLMCACGSTRHSHTQALLLGLAALHQRSLG